MTILTWDRADELVDLDPLRLRDEAMTSIEALRSALRVTRRALGEVAVRGLDSDNEDVRAWSREWVEQYRHLIFGSTDG